MPNWLVSVLTIALLVVTGIVVKRSNTKKISFQRKILGSVMIVAITVGAIWIIFKQFYP